jgi:excisionase family DNA binding protein
MQPLLSVKQAAEQLNCSAALVYDLCARQQLAFIRIGPGRKAIRIAPEALVEYTQRMQVVAPLPTKKEPTRRVVLQHLSRTRQG